MKVEKFLENFTGDTLIKFYVRDKKTNELYRIGAPTWKGNLTNIEKSNIVKGWTIKHTNVNDEVKLVIEIES